MSLSCIMSCGWRLLRERARCLLIASALLSALVQASGCASAERAGARILRPGVGDRDGWPAGRVHLLRGRTVVVDAGHGGRDPGAPGVGPVPEKVVNLALAQRLASMLAESGAKVILSRGDDRFIELDARAELAERTRTDLFVSIHSDAAQRPEAYGSTVFIARGAQPASRHAAECIRRALEREGIACRGIEEAGFRVLVGHNWPAVLVECGFLTNPREAKLLAESRYQGRIARALARGVIDHFAAR